MRRSLYGIGMAVLLLAATGPALAQPPAPEGGTNSFQFRFGGFFPSGGGELWDANESVFTLRHGDFNDAILGLTYVAGITNNFEIGFNVDFFDSTVRSQDNGIIGDVQTGLHPEHDTELTMVPVTVDFRFLPGGRYAVRGRRGQYHVRQPVFYLGGGAGMNFWTYEERGSFIFEDPETSTFFEDFDHFKSNGTAFEAHALAGVELPVGQWWSVLIEGRYSWSNGNVHDAYLAPANLKMDGTVVYLGGSVHF